MAATQRPLRLNMPGKSPHPINEAVRQAESSQSTKIPRERGSSLGARLARGLSRSSHRDRGSSDDENNGPGSSSLLAGSGDSVAVGSVGSPDTTFFSGGDHKTGQNIPIVGLSDDPNATVETRKKNALIKGPIINLDHSLNESYGLELSLLTALKDLYECISENESRTGVASPTFFVDTLKKENELFRSSAHQDAHEFLNFLLNRVIEQIDLAPGESSQWVKDLFMGELTNETRCMSCETVSRRNEQFVDFSIDLEANTSVYNCLTQFSASEVLGGSNKFYCDCCGGLQEAQKRMKVRMAPKVLTLHLKRFKFNEELQRNTKLLHRVLYSQYIRLPVTTEDCQKADRLYELVSVVIHLGGGPYQGHYVAVTRTDQGWLLFDDEVVEAVDNRYVYRFFGDKNQLATAYVLFYQEVSQSQYEQDNAYLRIPSINMVPIPGTFASNYGHGSYNGFSTRSGSGMTACVCEDDQDSLLTSSDIYGMSISEEEEPNVLNGSAPDNHWRRGSVPNSSGSVSSTGEYVSSTSPISASAGSASISRFDSIKRKRDGSKLFGILRRSST